MCLSELSDVPQQSVVACRNCRGQLRQYRQLQTGPSVVTVGPAVGAVVVLLLSFRAEVLTVENRVLDRRRVIEIMCESAWESGA